MNASNLSRRSQPSWMRLTRRDPRVEFADKPDLTADIHITDNAPVFVGTYSYILRGHCRGHKVAIKVIRVVTKVLSSMRRKVGREREVWGHMDHPNIAPLYGYTEPNQLFGDFGAFISPWYKYGDAGKFLRDHGSSLTMDQRYILWQGVIIGVAYLHTHIPVIVHGDLKPGNVLIDDEGNPRICDFGLCSIFLEDGHSGLTTTAEHAGTDRYLAPELLDSDARPTTASDIYALGCIGLEFLFLELPFSNQRSGRIRIERYKNNPPPARRPEVLSQEMAELWNTLEACWHVTPTERITATALLAPREPVGYADDGGDPVNESVEASANVVGIVGIVIHDFQDDTVPGALRLHRGEYIEQIEQLNDEWWYGVAVSDTNRRGLFHDDRIKLIGTGQVPGLITPKTAEALKPYGAGGSSGISFLKGDRITNVQVNTLTGKWKGTANGRTGSFLASYVKLVA